MDSEIIMSLFRPIHHSKCAARLIPTAAGIAVLLAVLAFSPIPGLGQPALETLIYRFGNPPDGSSPNAGLVIGPDRALYGTTSSGGTTTNNGTVFKINVDGSGYTVLHNFTNTPDGTIPLAALLFGTDGRLYGTASAGGADGLGIIFKSQLNGSSYEVLHDFNNIPDGAFPFAGLMQATNGALYGTAHLGGTNGQGTIFTIQTNGNGFQVLYSFTSSPDGATPQDPLIQGNDGALYGTTYSGGLGNRGTIFKIQLDGSGYQVLRNFTNSSEGSGPRGALLQTSDGALYGATQVGGAANIGVVFKMNPDGGGYTVLHNFNSGLDGSRPFGGLIQGLDNLLYGATGFGGTNSAGCIYRMQLGGSGYEVIHHFGGANDGGRPSGNLTRGASLGDSGVLYGTTIIGGFGTVFAVAVNPQLTITPVVTQTGTNGPVVLWPTFAYNYVLQTTTNLNSGPWVTVTNGVPVTGLQLTNLPNPSGSYFRLVWPQ